MPFSTGWLAWAISGGGLRAAIVSFSPPMQVVGYYIATPPRGFPVAEREIAFWTACALIGGPAFGRAGRACDEEPPAAGQPGQQCCPPHSWARR